MTELRCDLAEECDHRRAVLLRGVDADREVRGAHHPCPHAHGGSARDFRVRLGHEGRAALVPCRDHADARLVVQCVKHAHEALARYAERVIHTRGDERVDDGAPGRDLARAHGMLM